MSSAAARSRKERERFSRPLVVGGIVAGFIGLLTLFYPEQLLQRILLQDGARVPATRVYLESLLRVRPGDHAVRRTLVSVLLETGQHRRALEVLDAAGVVESSVDRDRYRRLSYEALSGAVRKTQDGDLRHRYERLAAGLLQQSPSVELASRIAADASQSGLSALAEQARKVLAQIAPLTSSAAGSEGYRQRAEAAFAAQSKAATADEQRRYFLQGVRILQEGNLYREAMEAAEQHLGMLADDRATLIAMTRIALAVGHPERAQRYVRRALGMGGAQ